ncbi:MAG: YcgL domain-containing protein, partial [Gammaproteobacteria bacterium]
MKCFIYSSSNKPDLYIYLAEEDNFENVPKAMYDSLGNIAFSMELDLSEKTRLARDDINVVKANLKEHGFHIQLPGDE